MSQTVRAKLPPGPRIPRWVQVALMLRHASKLVSACGRRYGSVFTLRLAGVGTLVYLSDPADIKTVFGGDPSVFHAGEANSLLSGLLGDNSLLVVDDDLHRDRRRLMLPPFHRDAVARQAEVMAEIATANIAGWPVGRGFAVAPKMSEITLEVILRTVIGATDPARLAALRCARSCRGCSTWVHGRRWHWVNRTCCAACGATSGRAPRRPPRHR